MDLYTELVDEGNFAPGKGWPQWVRVGICETLKLHRDGQRRASHLSTLSREVGNTYAVYIQHVY